MVRVSRGDTMDFLERVLQRRSRDLVHHLTCEAGFSAGQAERFLCAAGPALVRSYEWQADTLGPDPLGTPTNVRELLSGISARAVALEVGLSTEQTWDGLRTLVPAVLRPAAQAGDSSYPRPGGGSGPRSGRAVDETLRFEIGFGLALDQVLAKETSAGSEDTEAGDGSPRGADGDSSHPIFGYLLRQREPPTA